METNQELSNGSESALNAEFVVPDSQDQDSDLLHDFHSRDLPVPALQNQLKPSSPILFECYEDPVASMSSKKQNDPNPFPSERDTETDPAEALVADTASDFSGNSSRDESEKNATVITRVSPGKPGDYSASTPAQKLACLQLSGNPTLVPETYESLDAVPPSLDAFDPHPTIVPDSPTADHGLTATEDDDGDVISFKPVMPTMNNEETKVTQASTQYSLGVIESQNFHLHLSPSQATSVQEENELDNAQDFGLIPGAVTLDERLQVSGTSSSQNQTRKTDNISHSKPSFHLQKPAITSTDADPLEDETEGSISVFKRIKSGIASPLKLKRIADDSEEVIVPKSAPQGVKSQQFLSLTESSFIKPSEKGRGSEKKTFSKQATNNLVSDNIHTDSCNQGLSTRPVSENTKMHRNKEGIENTMVFTEENDSNFENLDETLSYSYTDMKTDTTHNIQEGLSKQFSQSSSDNFVLSQKRMIPSVSKEMGDCDEHPGAQTDLHGDKDEDMSVIVLGSEGHDESMQVSPGEIQKQPKSHEEELDQESERLLSARKENQAASSSKDIDAGVKLPEESKTVTSKEDPVVVDDANEASQSLSKYQSFAEGSTLAQSSSLDPYTFHGSQSQSYDAGAKMPLSDKPYISSRKKKAAVIKTMRKVLKKKNPCQQVGNKSSSSDVSMPETSKTRQERRRKGSMPAKSVNPDTEQVSQTEAFTALQDRNNFSRPNDPPPSKGNIKNVAGSPSTHHSTQEPSKDQHCDAVEGQKLNRKNATVSFSTSAVTPQSAQSVMDSPYQEVERITIQEVITSEVIVSKRTIKEVFNSKGQSLHKSETTEVIRKVKFEPQVTQQDVTEKHVTSGLVISPSRSTSTVTTGDLADISSSSLSRTFSSGSKTSLEILPSSQTVPTPAQRQVSTQRPEGTTTLTSVVTTIPSGFTVDVPTASMGKPDSKRSSAGSNTGQDLFSTPNQSIINPADSQLGKVLSSSTISTPDQQCMQNISPSQGLVPGPSCATSHRNQVSHSPTHHGPSFPPVMVVTTSKDQYSPITRGQNKQAKVIPGTGEKGLSSNVTSEKSSTTPSKSIAGVDLPVRTGSNRGKTTSSKDDVSQATDIQSTGFSVHGAPASGDSGKGLASTVTSAKTNLSTSAQISLQGAINKEQYVPYYLNDYKSKPTKGAKIMGRWKDGFYYSGSLSKVETGKRAMVEFDDGSLRWVRPNEIIMASDLPVGQSVLVLAEGEDGFYLPGMVMGHTEPLPGVESEVLFYQVERDDGVIQRCTRSSLILSEDQAACLLSDEELRFSTDALTLPSTKPADISLDNLVEGKRSLRSVQQPGPSSSKSADPSSPPHPSAKDIPGTSANISSRKRKMGPVATSTPTPKQARRKGKDSPVKKNERNDLGGVMSSPVESRKSPRKLKIGPLSFCQPKNSSLFEGMVFMLTHAEKSANWRAYEKKLMQYSSLDTSVDESTDVEFDVTPYDKERLQFLIQQCGGKIVSSLDLETIASSSQCFLVASEHQRTVKYMQALAARIQIISHQWVLLSVRENKLQGLVAYTLPAGISYEKKKLLEGSKGCPELSHQVIMVVSNNDDFVKAWTSILSLTRCKLATKFPARASKNDPGVDVVVSDATCPANLVRRCTQLNVPLVSSEWVAQCLINGKMVGFKDHLKYKHDFMEDEAATIVL